MAFAEGLTGWSMDPPSPPQAFCSMLVITVVMVMDGISIGSSDFQHLPRTSLIATIGTWGVLSFAAAQEWCVNSRTLAPQKLTGLISPCTNPVVDFKGPYSNRPFKP
jgi:hypothetical protein